MPMLRRSQRACSEAFFQRRASEQVPQITSMREMGRASPHIPLLLDARKWDLVHKKESTEAKDSEVSVQNRIAIRLFRSATLHLAAAPCRRRRTAAASG